MALPDQWIDDSDPDDDEPDFEALCSDPVGLISDQFFLVMESMQAEGFTQVQIAAGTSLALADLTQEMVGESPVEE